MKLEVFWNVSGYCKQLLTFRKQLFHLKHL